MNQSKNQPKPARRRTRVVQMTDVTGRGGAEKALVDLALRLDRRRYDVSVLATRSAGNYQPLLDAAGVETRILHRDSAREMYKMADVVKQLRRDRVQVLHSHLFGANTWGRMLGKLAGVPAIIAHEHWSSKADKEVWIDRLLYRLSDRIIVPSEASKRLVMSMERIPGRAISVVYNGVDITKFKPDLADRTVRHELGFPDDALVLGMVGRLSPDKGGQAPLLRGFSQARKKYPQLRLLVVGDGPLRPELEQLAAQLELGDSTTFLGQRSDITRLLGALDLFVLPSLMEALPIAVLEAMAMRLPVIATDVGGVPEVVIDGRTGLMVPPGSAEALQAAIERLAEDPNLARQLGSAGYARVLECFTLEQMVRQVEGIYDGILRKKRRRVTMRNA